MKRQQVTGNNQQSKNETPLVRGVLQRSAVSHEMDDVQAKDDHEAQALMNSAFSQDYSKVPITGTQPQQLPGLNPPRYLMPPIQAKLTIGQPNDRYEQEADRVASQVVQQINAPASTQSNQGESILGLEEPEEELQAKFTLQRRDAIASREASTDLESAIARARGSGQALAPGLQAQMGQAMGADFSGVRVHTDAQSDQLNQSIQAKAFTTGKDVFFRQGAYQPRSREGQELIAHELTHVVQQGKTTGTLKATHTAEPSVQRAIFYKGSKTAPTVTQINLTGNEIKTVEELRELHIDLLYNHMTYQISDKEYEDCLVILHKIIAFSKHKEKRDVAQKYNEIDKDVKARAIAWGSITATTIQALDKYGYVPWSGEQEPTVALDALQAYEANKVPENMKAELEFTLYSQYESKSDVDGGYGEEYRVQGEPKWVVHVHRGKSGVINVATVQAIEAVGNTSATRAMPLNLGKDGIPGIQKKKAKPNKPEVYRLKSGQIKTNAIWQSDMEGPKKRN